MAQAADYFLAAMDRYEEARNRKQEMAMQQEQHALYMKNGLMQLDQLQQKVSAGDEFQAIVRDPAMASQATTQQPQQQPLAEGTPAPSPTPGFDSSALHKTLSQMSGYMNEFNGARGNSGFGTTLSMHPQQDGSYIIGAANPEQGGAYPLTVNPQDNSSAPLRVAPETVGPMQQYVQGRIDATGGDPAKMAALAKDQFGLRHDEQGNIYVPAPDLAAAPAPQTPSAGQPAPQPAVQPTSPAPGTKTKTSVSGSVSTKTRFNKDTVHDPVKFYEAAADPNLRPDARDRKVLQQIDMDHTYAMGIPLHQRGKVAALGLKAGYFNGDQALNMAQTGFSNMNSMELENAMTALKMNKVQFRKAELDYTNALRYDGLVKQAQLNAYNAQTQASTARITASTEAAATQRAIRQGSVNTKVMTLIGEAFDRYAKQNNIDPDRKDQLKAGVQPAVAAALTEKYGGDLSAVVADGRTPQALQQFVDSVVASQLDPARKTPVTAFTAANDVLEGKEPDAVTRKQVIDALPKDQAAATQRAIQQGSVNTNVMTLIGEAIDRYGLQNNIDPEKMKQLKAVVQPAVAAALTEKYGGDLSAVVADGRTPQALQQFVDSVVASQLDPTRKKPVTAYTAANDVLGGKEPGAVTRKQVIDALPKDQAAAAKENDATMTYITKIADGVGSGLGFKNEDEKKAFSYAAAKSLMTIMPMIGLRGADLQGNSTSPSGSVSSNIGFTDKVIRSFASMKKADATRGYGDDNLMMVAVTNKLAEVPADVEAQQTREVMLRLEVLGHGNNYYHQMVTRMMQDGVPNKDLFKASLGKLDEEIARRGEMAKLESLRAAQQHAQSQPGNLPWAPKPTLNGVGYWK